MKGEYVDFVLLLHENSTPSPTAHNLLTRARGELRKSPSILLIDGYRLSLCSLPPFYPRRAVEMFSYLNIIQSAHKKLLGLSWLAYDMDFRRRATQDPTLTWSKIHPQLHLEKAIPTLILSLHFAWAYGRASGLVILVPGHTQPTYVQPDILEQNLLTEVLNGHTAGPFPFPLFQTFLYLPLGSSSQKTLK